MGNLQNSNSPSTLIFSPFLQRYLKTRFPNKIWSETKATCADCLCSKPHRGNLPYYHSDLKCCTFHPFLPNFAVGAILKSASINPESRKVVETKILNREYALPLGLFAPVRYQVIFNNRSPSDFGNLADLLCPYFNKTDKNCGIWNHRGSVCSTYFCTSDRGEAGLKEWEFMAEFLHICEMTLAQDCIVSLGLPHNTIDEQFEYINCETGTSEELSTNSMAKPLFEYYWREWSPRTPLEFYIRCAEYMEQLPFQQLTQILDSETSNLPSF